MCKIIFTILAIFCVIANVSYASNIQTITPIFSQYVVASFPSEFQTVFEDSNSSQYIRESVLKGESSSAWSQMITITGFKGVSKLRPSLTPEIFLDGIADSFKSVCGTSFNRINVSDAKIDGYDGFVAIISCGTANALNSETALVSVVKGDRDYYTIQWAERSQLSNKPLVIDREKWKSRLKELSPIRLCKRIKGEVAPYPSCLNPND